MCFTGDFGLGRSIVQARGLHSPHAASCAADAVCNLAVKVGRRLDVIVLAVLQVRSHGV